MGLRQLWQQLREQVPPQRVELDLDNVGVVEVDLRKHTVEGNKSTLELHSHLGVV